MKKLMIAAAMSLAVAAPAAAANRSGLPWKSGSSAANLQCLAQLRKRPMDAVKVFALKSSFAALIESIHRSEFRDAVKLAPLTVVSLPLLTDDTKSQFTRCAAGTYDSYFTKVGAALKGANAPSMIASLGWEANIGSKVHPWGYDTAEQLPAYRACFRRAVHVLRKAYPGLKIEWANAKIGAKVGRFPDSYPGDDVVDSFGLLFYDQGFPSGSHIGTDARWDQFYHMTSNGGPFGIGTWVEAALQHHKKLGIGEWAPRNDAPGSFPADDTAFMRHMNQFLRNNASSISYETYFNADSRYDPDTGKYLENHALCPTTVYPKSRDIYRQRWGR